MVQSSITIDLLSLFSFFLSAYVISETSSEDNSTTDILDIITVHQAEPSSAPTHGDGKPIIIQMEVQGGRRKKPTKWIIKQALKKRLGKMQFSDYFIDHLYKIKKRHWNNDRKVWIINVSYGITYGEIFE